MSSKEQIHSDLRGPLGTCKEPRAPAQRLSHCAIGNADLRLWIVGDGSERKTIEDLAAKLGISGQVTFWGQQLDVAPFFSAADAFVMSSRSEGLPMSLLQAFSLGLPSIVMDVGGMAEVVPLTNADFTVSLTDPSEMAAAILRMSSNHTEREQLSINADAAFQSHFTLRTMAEAYMNRITTPQGFGGKKP